MPEELKPFIEETEVDDGEGGTYYNVGTVYPRATRLSIKAGQTFYFYFAPTQSISDTDDSTVYNVRYSKYPPIYVSPQ